MASQDLKDTYLHVLIRPDKRNSQVHRLQLGLPVQGSVFRSLHCPYIFTRVMVSTFLHCAGIRIRRYLDDWLIQAPSRALVIQALDTVLKLCQDLGIVVNWEKSNLVPS